MRILAASRPPSPPAPSAIPPPSTRSAVAACTPRASPPPHWQLRAAAGHDPLVLDEAADARTPAPALRATARKLGRQMLRAARAAWPCEALERLARDLPGGAHQPVVLGIAAHAAGLTALDAAHAAAFNNVAGPATAAVRLLGLDPFDATAVLARLCDDVDAVARRAADAAARVTDEGVGVLPAASSPLLDITAEQHAAWPMRLFAS